jgi:hypothetical protein
MVSTGLYLLLLCTNGMTVVLLLSQGVPTMRGVILQRRIITWCNSCSKPTVYDDCVEEDWRSFALGSPVPDATSEPVDGEVFSVRMWYRRTDDCLAKIWRTTRLRGIVGTAN